MGPDIPLYRPRRLYAIADPLPVTGRATVVGVLLMIGASIRRGG